MASTNKTTNYELSQFIGTDKPTWLSDYNGDMYKIDAQMKTNATDIATAISGVESATATANQANTTASNASSTASSASATATQANTTATNAQSTANSALATATSAQSDVNSILAKADVVAWTNPSPNSDFAPANITLDSSDYDELEIYYDIDHTSSPRKMQSVKILKGESARIFTVSGAQLKYWTRDIDYVNDTTLSVENCIAMTSSGGSNANSMIIPIEIIRRKI